MMLAPRYEVTFRVRVTTKVGETVCVVGDCAELGNWEAQHAKTLKLEKNNGSEEIWSTVVPFPTPGTIKYRYFTGYLRESDNEGETVDVIIQRWETALQPRSLDMLGQNLPDADVATFGYIDSKEAIDQGWITGQTQVYLRLIGNPINMWKAKQRNETYRIKCSPIDLRYKDIHMDNEDEDSNMEFPAAPNRIDVALMRDSEDTYKEQGMFGTPHQHSDFMIFRAQTFEPEYLGYQFDFYIDRPTSDVHKHVGFAYLLPVNLGESTGIKILPISGLKHKPIGEFTVNYLLVKPMRNHICDMSLTYARYWKPREGLDVGHRGMGNSYTKKLALVRENTIASLQEAVGHGADYVEFDVQLSSDLVPIVYHDFTVCLSLRKKSHDGMELFTIPVSDLSLTQLQMLRLEHASEKHNSESSEAALHTLHSDPLESHPFPTLRQVFDTLDPDVGFNIEIKYCLEFRDGQMEEGLKFYKERNAYIDIILKEILENAGRRRIVLSCFDPDVCTMIRAKQNKYPVLFLVDGMKRAKGKYKDPRLNDIRMASCFAHAENVLGIDPHAEDLLHEPELVESFRQKNLIVFSWGDTANSKENIKRLKDLGVDGVIYDNIEEHKPEGKSENIFKMEHKNKVQLLKQVGAISSEVAISAVSSLNVSPVVSSDMSEQPFYSCSSLPLPSPRVGTVSATCISNGSNGTKP